MTTTLNGYEVNVIDQMRWRYVTAGLVRMSQVRLSEAESLFGTFRTINIAATVCSIIALQIFYSSVYKRMISGLDKEIKNVRMLLLLFPDEVSENVPAIIKAGSELISDSTSVNSAEAERTGSPDLDRHPLTPQPKGTCVKAVFQVSAVHQGGAIFYAREDQVRGTGKAVFKFQRSIKPAPFYACEDRVQGTGVCSAASGS